MKGNFINKSLGFLFGALVLLSMAFVTNDAQANRKVGSLNRPQVPVLSLIGGSSYEKDWYPDGRIWLPKKHNGPREFLLPVFVNNRWFSYSATDANNQKYIPVKVDPIRSFRFKMLYDSSAVRAIGVQTHGPRHNEDDLDYTPLASEFNLTWHDTTDHSYWWYLRYDGVNPPPAIDYTKGRGITIAGSSSTPLPNTSLESEEFKVLLYVRFQVVPQYFSGTGNAGQNTPIYISNDTIKYNDMNVTTDTIFKKERIYDTTGFYNNEYGGPLIPPVNFYNYAVDAPVLGLAGMDSRTFNEGILPDKQMPGVIYLRYMDTLPKFSFEVHRGIGIQPGIKPDPNEGEELWILADPITVDENSDSPYPREGVRELDLLNVSTTTRLQDITIETDSKWLKVETKNAPNGKRVPKGRFGKINWLDNGILGPNGIQGPLGEVTTSELNRVTFRVICDPSELEDDDPKTDPNDKQYNETTGMYVGYITVKSPNAAIQTVRVKVTFIYFRNPLEGFENKDRGIRLNMRNSRAGSVQNTKLVFGTGHRGSTGVDSLFGEYGYETPLQGFGARFYPVDANGVEIPVDLNKYPGYYGYGLGDFASNDESNDPSTPNTKNKKSDSRDIRNYEDTLQSILYLVKFDAGAANNYPVVLSWDVKDFPDGAELYLRDTENGKKFPSVNMRGSNLLNNGVYSYTFFDAEIKEFLIEYTLPKVVDYIDEKGNPIIKKGWNLLSLPVKPLNSTWTEVYPNAQNIPYFYYQSGYVAETVLREGVGYFVKYGDIIDRKFSGSYISNVSKARNNSVDLFPGDVELGGWNTIGALSTPVSINCIDFDQYDAQNKPLKDFTFKYGVWGYKTKEGYKEVSTLQPGLGYWIKVNKRGYLKLAQNQCKVGTATEIANYKNDVRSNATQITVSDNGQSSNTVYITRDNGVATDMFSLPPVPPTGLFDIRFDNGSSLVNTDNNVLVMQGVEYPISISVDNALASYTFEDAVTGEVLGTVTKGGNSSFVISTPTSNLIRVKRATAETGAEAFDLSCYPNPATGLTNFNFFLPEAALVNIQVVDQIGNVVANVAKEFNANDNTYAFDASTLPSGSYIVRISAANYNSVAKFTVVR